MKIGFLVSHPIQYHVPLFRALAENCELTVLYGHEQNAAGQADAGYGVSFEWDIDLTSGFKHLFLTNITRKPNVSSFFGVRTERLEQVLELNQFDVVIVGGWNLYVYWQMVFACRRKGIPVVARGDSHLGTPRSWLRRKLKDFIYPFVLGRFSAHLPVSAKSEEYLRHYKIPAHRCYRNMHVVDNDRFANGSHLSENVRRELYLQLGLDEKRRTVLFVGRLILLKHVQDILLAVASSSLIGSTQILIVGEGPTKEQLVEQSLSLGVKVSFAGFRNQVQLPKYYGLADVLVLPSEHETWGLVVNEAMASGVPVVVSNQVGCAEELVDSSQTGEVFEFGNASDLSVKLSKVLNHGKFYYTQKLASKIQSHSPKAASNLIIGAISCLLTHASSGTDA